MQHFSAGRAIWSVLIGVRFISPARACPFCSSSTAQQVRDGIFNSDFAYNFGVAAAPFVVLVAVLVLILYWPLSSAEQVRGDPVVDNSKGN